MNKVEKLEQEIKEMQDKLEKLKKQKIELTSEQELAIILHSKFCRHNHTDGCGWHYEVHEGTHNWSGYSHESWLKKARDIIDSVELTGEKLHDIKTIIEAL